MKIEVKQKIDDHLGSGVEERLTLGVLLVSHPTELRQEINGDAGKRIVAMHALSFSDAKLFSQDNQRAERVADGDRERWYLGNHSQSQIIAAIALEAHVVTD